MASEANTGGITPAERARLAALLAQATPGPWSVDVDRPDEGELVITIPQIERTLHHPEWAQRSERRRDMANARLIVAAVNALPALLAACDAAEAWQRRIIDAIQPQRPEDPPATLGMDVHEAATVVAVLDGLRERARDRKRRADEAEHRARDAYRRGQERMREAAVAKARSVADGSAGNARGWGALHTADAIAALPITDAEEVPRG